MKLGLLSKMLLCLLLPVLLGTALLTGIAFYMGDNMLQEQLDQDTKVTVNTAGIAMDAIFTGLQEALLPVTENQRIVDLVTTFADGGKNAMTPELLKRGDDVVHHFVEGSHLVFGAFIIGTDGTTLSGYIEGQPANTSNFGKSRADQPFFQEAMRSGNMALSTIFPPGEQVQTVLAQPIKFQGRLLGVATARLLNSAISKATSDRVIIGKKGRAYAYDMNGRVVLAIDKNRIGRDESMLPHVRTMMQNRNGEVEFKNNDGAKFLYFKELPQEHWIICVEVDQEEMLAPTYNLLRNLTLVAIVLGLVIGGVIFFAARGIAKTTAGLAGIADSVAAGHLDASPSEVQFLMASEKRGDEFSTLAVAMRTMMKNLEKLLQESQDKTTAAEKATKEAQEATRVAEEATKQAENAKREGMLAAAHRLEDMVNAISAAASQLSAQIEESDRGAVESSERLTEAATAMNEMNSTVQEVAQNASSASTVSLRTKNNAEDGQKILTNAMASINQVQKVSMELKEDMSKLHEHTQNISQIMNVISDIADQTNLLALNAAIEAARAGEAGRGFAVVADEVRKLAEKTMASTNDVSQAITAIQSSAQQSVNRMEEAMQNVEQATSLAQESGNALNKIVSDVEETADQVRAIATASEEQSAASEEINRSISTVSEMSTQTTQAMNEAARAISDLAQQTERLSTLIGEMKRG